MQKHDRKMKNIQKLQVKHDFRHLQALSQMPGFKKNDRKHAEREKQQPQMRGKTNDEK
jgi:hypothetical protein